MGFWKDFGERVANFPFEPPTEFDKALSENRKLLEIEATYKLKARNAELRKELGL